MVADRLRYTAIGVFQTYYEMGPLSNYSASTISWIPAFEVFMMFLGVCITTLVSAEAILTFNRVPSGGKCTITMDLDTCC